MIRGSKAASSSKAKRRLPTERRERAIGLSRKTAASKASVRRKPQARRTGARRAAISRTVSAKRSRAR